MPRVKKSADPVENSIALGEGLIDRIWPGLQGLGIDRDGLSSAVNYMVALLYERGQINNAPTVYSSIINTTLSEIASQLDIENVKILKAYEAARPRRVVKEKTTSEGFDYFTFRKMINESLEAKNDKEVRAQAKYFEIAKESETAVSNPEKYMLWRERFEIVIGAAVEWRAIYNRRHKKITSMKAVGLGVLFNTYIDGLGLTEIGEDLGTSKQNVEIMLGQFKEGLRANAYSKLLKPFLTEEGVENIKSNKRYEVWRRLGRIAISQWENRPTTRREEPIDYSSELA